MTSVALANKKVDSMHSRKMHNLHTLLIEIYFSNNQIPEKLTKCLENIQTAENDNKRSLLTQQAIGYVVACKDFNLIENDLCDYIINVLHDVR